MAAELDKYRCITCGWIYDPKLGDLANEVPRGIPFEKLPDNFTCGVCGVVGKDKFVKIEAPAAKKKK